jgi:hypothetical protein
VLAFYHPERKPAIPGRGEIVCVQRFFLRRNEDILASKPSFVNGNTSSNLETKPLQNANQIEQM